MPILVKGQKSKVDTIQINTQLATVKSLVEVREFSAAKKIALKVYADADAVDYTAARAWAEYYLGIISFEITPIDSAFYWLKKAKTDFSILNNQKALIKVLNRLGIFYRRTDVNDSSLYYYNLALDKAQAINDSSGLAEANYGLGMVSAQIGNYGKALEHYSNSLAIREKINDKAGIASVYNSMGILFWEQGAYSTALDFFFKALPLRVEIKDRQGEAFLLNNIGLIFRDVAQYDKALDYLRKSWKIKIEINDKRGTSNSLMNIGSVYLLLGQIDSALLYFENALALKQVMHDRGGVANINRFLGEAYMKIKMYDKAQLYLTKAIDDYTSLQEPRGVIESKYDYALLLFEMGNALKAFALIDEVLVQAKKHGMMDMVAQSYKALYQFNLARNNCQAALQNYERYNVVKDSIAGTEKMKQILAAQLQVEYENIVRQHLDRFNEQLSLVDSQKRSRTRMLIIVAIAFVLLLGLFIGLLYTMYKRKQALFEVENQRVSVDIKQRELQEQRDELEQQRNLVIYQRDRIINMLTDLGESIEYARKIQQAVFPTDTLLSQYFRDFFVFYLPKETVGGDFYWVGNCSGKVGFAVADCTGHGVPGGFMSMLGISMLNDLVANTPTSSPGLLLGKLRDNIISALRQGGHEDDSHDGMDVAFCTFDRESHILTFAGANMPIIISTTSYVPSNNERIVQIDEGLIEFRPDRMPIAYYERMERFNELSIKLEPNDTVYLFTDGFTDQFGGGKPSKKYGYQAFRNLVLNMKHLPLYEQKRVLYQTLEKWRGVEEVQTDDILIMAVKPF
ncbi:MAG: tetratricopeptide repeat protein [Bacteroidota bacterium]